MAESNLLYIGAILSIALGTLSLYLIRKNENLEWNERLAAHILCWMFIGKGIQNGAVGYINEIDETVNDFWQFLYAMSMLLDHAFSFSTPVGAVALRPTASVPAASSMPPGPPVRDRRRPFHLPDSISSPKAKTHEPTIVSHGPRLRIHP